MLDEINCNNTVCDCNTNQFQILCEDPSGVTLNFEPQSFTVMW